MLPVTWTRLRRARPRAHGPHTSACPRGCRSAPSELFAAIALGILVLGSLDRRAFCDCLLYVHETRITPAWIEARQAPNQNHRLLAGRTWRPRENSIRCQANPVLPSEPWLLRSVFDLPGVFRPCQAMRRAALARGPTSCRHAPAARPGARQLSRSDALIAAASDAAGCCNRSPIILEYPASAPSTCRRSHRGLDRRSRPFPQRRGAVDDTHRRSSMTLQPAPTGGLLPFSSISSARVGDLSGRSRIQ